MLMPMPPMSWPWRQSRRKKIRRQARLDPVGCILQSGCHEIQSSGDLIHGCSDQLLDALTLVELRVIGLRRVHRKSGVLNSVLNGIWKLRTALGDGLGI